MSEYLLKIILYHTLGSIRLDETPSRKDKAETVKIRSRLESDGSGGLRRAVRRQMLERLPRTKSTGKGPQVGRCYLKETAAFIYPFLRSLSYSFIQIPTMCRYWVEWWEERVERGQRVHGLERKQRISVIAVGFKELGWTYPKSAMKKKVLQGVFNSMWTAQGSIPKGMLELSLEV